MPQQAPTLMAVGALRDALTAHRRDDIPTVIAALMSIDTDSWHAIEERLAVLGGSFPELLADVRKATT